MKKEKTSKNSFFLSNRRSFPRVSAFRESDHKHLNCVQHMSLEMRRKMKESIIECGFRWFTDKHVEQIPQSLRTLTKSLFSVRISPAWLTCDSFETGRRWLTFHRRWRESARKTQEIQQAVASFANSQFHCVSLDEGPVWRFLIGRLRHVFQGGLYFCSGSTRVSQS